MEYVRSHLFTGFGWALLGHSQYLNLPIIQIADITGAYGVSFVAMMVNVVIYTLLNGEAKKGARAFFVLLLIISGVLGYGYLKLNNTEAAKGDLKISLIQGNIPQKMKWDSEFIDHIWSVYSTLTREAGRDNPDLIIWPETALPGYMEDRELYKAVAQLARNTGSALLIGAPSYRESDEAIFNSAFLIGEGGDIIERYDKLHLVPFGEYIPFSRYIGFIRKVINKPIGTFGKGDEYTIFELENGLRFGVLICFEDIFANHVRRFAARDADFMVNITNDAWFMKTAAPYQHTQSSVFRAVENRMPLVRAANTGLSCFIDRTGRIFDSVKVGADEIFVAGYKTNKIDMFNAKSPYTRFGNIFVFLCALAVIIDSILSRRSKL
jgi:apolipoprotein N-acyltransferase